MSKAEKSEERRYRTGGGIEVRRCAVRVDADAAVEAIAEGLDVHRGALLSSSFEFPGRYTRWDLGFVDPPLAVTGRGRAFEVAALSDRGAVLLPAVAAALAEAPEVASLEVGPREVRGEVPALPGAFAEEARSRRPTLLSVVRALRDLFASDEDRHLGLYGAFGYDLGFQFEPVVLRHPRPADQRDLALYLPDSLVVVDHRLGRSHRFDYDFVVDGESTEALPRTGEARSPTLGGTPSAACDHTPEAYQAGVRTAVDAFRRGDLFEAVLSQTFAEPLRDRPSAVFRRLRTRNPAPYGFLLHLGEGEHLVGASPEMFVRVEGDRVETCPIAGTAKRGADALEDARRIFDLLASKKEEAELTMCTDVDRNDKARICVSGSVKVIGRRQVEMYSRLVHTVDHVEGRLRPGFDALDAFLAHAWAVTVTGAPKADAMQLIEDLEAGPRRWYAGAVGAVGFDGSINTGLTLRTVRLHRGVAEVRAGATLLHASDPEAEEEETRTKASALLDAITRDEDVRARVEVRARVGEGSRVLLIDHRDSFVHTLGDYFRQTGAEVETRRSGFELGVFDAFAPDLVVLSPGPGRPSHFPLERDLALVVERGLPCFGVCLGLQAMVEHFGGELGLLARPVHGEASTVSVHGGALFDGVPRAFSVGRYHSLYALRPRLPDSLVVTATTEDGVVMGIEHVRLPLHAVQFHPESILTEGGHGHRLVENAVRMATVRRRARRAS